MTSDILFFFIEILAYINAHAIIHRYWISHFMIGSYFVLCVKLNHTHTYQHNFIIPANHLLSTVDIKIVDVVLSVLFYLVKMCVKDNEVKDLLLVSN